MRIATYYGDKNSCGRNDGGPLYYNGMLRILFGNDNVSHIFPIGDLSRFGKFDYHFLVDWGEDALGFEKFDLPHPSIYVTSDTHLGYDYRLSRARLCDFIFCNQKKAVDDFIRDGIPKERVMWLPHAFDPLAYSPGVFNLKKNAWDTDAVPLKKYDVCFIGNLNDENRVNHLDRLFKEFPNFYWGTQRFHEAAEKFNQARIVFNVSARKELNMRFFEALGSGAFLLTDKIDCFPDDLKDGVHFASYSDMDEMIYKARFYLDNPEEMERIALNGHLAVRNKHSYMNRLMTILDRLGVQYEKSKAMEYLPKEKEAVCQST